MAKRTDTQNRALHLYLSQVADELDREGHTMQNVTESIRRAEIRPTKESIKEVVWKPLQSIILAKNSTTQLDKVEVDKVYEAMNAWLGREFGIHVPWPSDDEKQKSDMMESLNKREELMKNYPDEHKSPKL